MKTKSFFSVFLVVMCLFCLTSCSNVDGPSRTLTEIEYNYLMDFEVKPLGKSSMRQTYIDLKKCLEPKRDEYFNRSVRERTPNDSIVLHPIDPYIEIGMIMREELINKIRNNDFPEDVIASHEDIQFIIQADSVQLATLGFAYSALSLAVEENEEGMETSEITLTMVGECLFQSTGIPAMVTIVTSTKALMTKQAAVKLFKVLAKRYIGGYLSLAWAIIDFLDCLGLTE